MSTIAKLKPGKTDFAAIAKALGKDFAARAEVADETDGFVADNYAALKTSGLVEAAVPVELGGGGATRSSGPGVDRAPRDRPPDPWFKRG